jgi:hypothetical protein
MHNFSFVYNYYICDDIKLVAENHKAASTSLAKSILQTYYPEIYQTMDHDKVPFVAYHMQTPSINKCVDKDVYVLVRDPIEKFISLATFMSLESRLDIIIGQLQDMYHPDHIPDFQTDLGHAALNSVFHPQIGFGAGSKNTYYFKYPNQIEDFVHSIGISSPLDQTNVSSKAKIQLNNSQINKLSKIYKEDISLYNSL